MKDIVIYYVIFILAGLTILGEEEKYKFNEPIFIVLGTIFTYDFQTPSVLRNFKTFDGSPFSTGL